MELGFIDTNIWLYRLFDDQRIDPKERERKRNIAISITDTADFRFMRHSSLIPKLVETRLISVSTCRDTPKSVSLHIELYLIN